jgi:hypothetical protein
MNANDDACIRLGAATPHDPRGCGRASCEPLDRRRWIKSGHLAAAHVGPGTVRIRPEDIEPLTTPTTETEDE